ncbi:hypothetical protein ACJRO7_019379 [Eucalyptus globulus]|uniref:Uncharacterized protein n=1 Tax=Eucalyptus globulus TaxID=34317 RepID=A0ABD3KIX2_EUCGL
MEKCRTKLRALAILLAIASCFVASHAEHVTCEVDPDCKPKQCAVGFVPICATVGLCDCKKTVKSSSCDKPEDCRYICGHPTEPKCFKCVERRCVCLCF